MQPVQWAGKHLSLHLSFSLFRERNGTFFFLLILKTKGNKRDIFKNIQLVSGYGSGCVRETLGDVYTKREAF